MQKSLLIYHKLFNRVRAFHIFVGDFLLGMNPAEDDQDDGQNADEKNEEQKIVDKKCWRAFI